jgi:hypothetical protein
VIPKPLSKRLNARQDSGMTINQHHAADADIELQILSELSQLKSNKIQISINHVYGLSKKRLPKGKTLSPIQQMNEIADSLCKNSRTCRPQRYIILYRPMKSILQ